MELNEFTTYLDVKLDVHDKRPNSLKLKHWTRCEVKIEAVKCLPCFLRITIKACDDEALAAGVAPELLERTLSVSINVPGVSISLASSRTKEFSYGLFWTHNRKNCFIYFALETEQRCRSHMKWIKKSIKNLELYRQVCLEHRRISRGPTSSRTGEEVPEQPEGVPSQLGPLPQIPNANNSLWSLRSHVSEIYEEIFDGSERPRLSRRLSRTSVASGIYEEMKPVGNNFNAIAEESTELPLTPPPLPPLPPHRKRINTFETSGVLGEIPRSNTNPESELAKKKKYKNMLDNIFGGSGRSKRAESVSETHACTAEDLINSATPPKHEKQIPAVTPIYANDAVVAQKQREKLMKMTPAAVCMAQSKRNSFSSPDLSKINFLDTFDEDKVADLFNNSLSHSDELNLSSASLEEWSAEKTDTPTASAKIVKKEACVNVSQRIPVNFNFSACNTSTINLMGAHGAAPSAANGKKNKIEIDDLTGYCVMAPISKKTTNAGAESGYSTASCASKASTNGPNSTEEQSEAKATNPVEADKPPNTIEAPEDSCIYEQMQATNTSTNDNNAHSVKHTNTTEKNPPMADFTGNLYENLLAVKASQELEQQLPAGLSTSTPTESPLVQHKAELPTATLETEENYYQTPRKSIISVDDKIPSYYPNSCDTVKTRRQPQSSPSPTASVNAASISEKTSTTAGLRHLVTLKMRREPKENLFITSPQCIIEQRQQETPASTATTNKFQKAPNKSKKSAFKIGEHVYTVKHTIKQNNNSPNQNNNNNDINQRDDMKERLQTELLQLAMLQKIDFRFDDASSTYDAVKPVEKSPTVQSNPQEEQKTPENTKPKERIYENLMHKYTHNLWKFNSAPNPTTGSVSQHHLQTHQAANVQTNSKLDMQFSYTEHVIAEGALLESVEVDAIATGGGTKKFASLPRFKKFDFSPLRLKISNVLQRSNQGQEF